MDKGRNPGTPDILPHGTLRLALFPSFFYRRTDADGTLRGVGIEVARALAGRIGVALDCAEYPSPPQVVETLAVGAADVALLGIDPLRGNAVDFSPPLFAADFSYLVAANSFVHTIADADQKGIRIALVRHHAMDTALRGQLMHAERCYADTPDDAFAMYRAGHADVLAGIRPGLLMYAARLPETRVLDDRYGRNVIAFAVRKGAAGLLSYVSAFVEQAKADGTIDSAIAAADLNGVEVARA